MSGHSLPSVYSGTVINIISSSVNSSTVTAEFQCYGCTIWSSGTYDISSTSADFIWAYGAHAPDVPSNPNSSFTRHDSVGSFVLDLKAAQTTLSPKPEGATNGTPTSTTVGLVPSSTGQNKSNESPSDSSVPPRTGRENVAPQKASSNYR
jgi:cellobiose dehydrogenase (acceptor)